MLTVISPHSPPAQVRTTSCTLEGTRMTFCARQSSVCGCAGHDHVNKVCLRADVRFWAADRLLTGPGSELDGVPVSWQEQGGVTGGSASSTDTSLRHHTGHVDHTK